jgi:hypothetical protein
MGLRCATTHRRAWKHPNPRKWAGKRVARLWYTGNDGNAVSEPDAGDWLD